MNNLTCWVKCNKTHFLCSWKGFYNNSASPKRYLSNHDPVFPVQFSRSDVSDSLQFHGLQHASFPVLYQLPEFAQTFVHWVDEKSKQFNFQMSRRIDISPKKTYKKWSTGLWNENQNHNEISPHTCQETTTKETVINAGEGVAKREPWYGGGGNINWCSHCGKRYGGSSKH